ncbi:PspC domain-containing protein [Rubrobacter indicoceani]|uniref:PspC domain-containing protein n=1 Tax=Rubrobacter indicoceani TaxID=2051957 RepID=UPI001F08B7C1|nr:PspC domain-containing protein [Rubrobacter indicoceani]
MFGITRTREDRWLLGVCGGIGRRIGWNPSVVRLVTIFAAAVVPGVSLLMVAAAYIILGMILPESPEF